MAERLKAAGAILIGKTNTPEFGAGSQTFNKVFGATRNPYDLSKTCGGSSGGAGVAVATGMLPFADGGDFAASLRNPGNYCNVIGFRPSTGRVPAYPHPYPWSNLSELGPMARTVSDAAFLLSVQAGPDRRAPTSISEPGSIFLKPLKRSFKKTRVAWSRDLGGLPVEPVRHQGARVAAQNIQGPGLHRGGRGARFHRRDRGLRVAARAHLAASGRRAAERAPRQAEGHGDLEHRGRPQAQRAGHRACREPAHRDVPPHAAVPREVRLLRLPGEPAAALPRRPGLSDARSPA